MFLGNNFQWFEGVVEGRLDPLKLGRVQVRVMGIHTEQKSKNNIKGIPSEELLWMHVLMPVTSAAMSGIGDSPTGLVEGSHVVGYFRDDFYQDGVIVGSLNGFYKYKPNFQKGFSDPNGQYPRYIGNDVNILAGGGQASEGGTGAPIVSGLPLSVKTRNDNASVAIKADPNTTYQEDNDPNFTIEEMLKQDEGVRYKWYPDSLDYPTIGIGHLIIKEPIKNTSIINSLLSQQVGRTVTDGMITEDEVSKLFSEDLQNVRSDILGSQRLGQLYGSLNASRKMAIENMCFQMGVGGVLKFDNALTAMEEQDWKSAHFHLLDSLWANQTPSRANRVSKIILSGNLESYGVIAPAPVNLRLFKSAVASSSSNTESRILFSEPINDFTSVYPYNHVYESESGHIIEIDDTPSQERYHRKHPTGTYEETRPDGTRVVKIVGDDYLIVKNGRNVNIKGNLQVVVEGNAVVYNMGNVTQTVDGNVTQLIKGNCDQHIEGNSNQTIVGESFINVKGNCEQILESDLTQTVFGNVVQEIDGNCDQTIGGNVTQTVEGNFNTVVSGSYSLSVGGAYSVNANTTTIAAIGTATISGSTINLN